MFFRSEMATLQIRMKSATDKKENQEEHARNNLSQDKTFARNKEDFISQIPEEIAGKVTKKLSRELSRT